jgi:hypothetical protein
MDAKILGKLSRLTVRHASSTSILRQVLNSRARGSQLQNSDVRLMASSSGGLAPPGYALTQNRGAFPKYRKTDLRAQGIYPHTLKKRALCWRR